MKRIVFTGGGTAGHVFPNLALIEALPPDKWSIHYLGICSGVEHKLIEEWNMKHKHNIVFHSIEGGKFRRDLSLKNVSDIFKISRGYKSSLHILENIQPHIVFSKGGYVSVPPSYAAHKYRIPIITHESDLSIGLANKLINRVADTICTSFPIENSDRRTIFTGNPIRQSILLGKKNVGRHNCHFKNSKPILLFMGGSQGSQSINNFLLEAIPYLIQDYQIIHLSGPSNPCFVDHENYMCFPFAGPELSDLYACADIVIGRAGANFIFEALALRIPMLLIPLPKKYSRGEQIANARYFQDHNFAEVIYQENLSINLFIKVLQKMIQERDSYTQSMIHSKFSNGTDKIVELIESKSLPS